VLLNIGLHGTSVTRGCLKQREKDVFFAVMMVFKHAAPDKTESYEALLVLRSPSLVNWNGVVVKRVETWATSSVSVMNSTVCDKAALHTPEEHVVPDRHTQREPVTRFIRLTQRQLRTSRWNDQIERLFCPMSG